MKYINIESFKFKKIYTKYKVLLWENSENIFEVGELIYNISIDEFILVEQQSEIQFSGGLRKETINIILEKNTLKIKKIEGKITINEKIIDFSGKYLPKKVDICIIDNMIKTEKSLKIDKYNIYDNYQLIINMMFIDFEKFKTEKLSVIHPLNPQILEVDLTLHEEAIIKTTMGEYNCYKLVLSTNIPIATSQSFYYLKDSPQFLIKSVRNKQITELVEYTYD